MLKDINLKIVSNLDIMLGICNIVKVYSMTHVFVKLV